MIARTVCLWLTAGTLEVPALPQPEAERKLGAVEGVVEHGATQEPLRYAEVLLRRQTDRWPPDRGGPLLSRATATDEAGKFRIQNIEPGNYNVTVSKAGFVLTGRDRAMGRMQIKVGAGDEVRGLRYSLTPQGVIAGRVVDVDGDPVAGVRVQAHRRMFLNDAPTWLPTAGTGITNDRGEYRIAELPPGRYLVRAAPREDETRVELGPSGERKATLATFYPGVTDHHQAQATEVRSGAEMNGIDFNLRRELVFRVRGTVISSTGAQMTKFSADAMPEERDGAVFSGGRARILGNGQFEFPRLQAGRWRIRARVAVPGEKEPWSGTTVVSVSNADVGNAVVNIQPPMAVSGRVRVEGENRLRLNAIQLLFYPAGGAVTPGADGRFAMTVPEPDVYRLTAEAGIPDGTYLASLSAGGQDLRSREVDFRGGLAELELVYRTDGPSVTVVVVPPEKEAVPETVTVVFVPQGETARFGNDVMVSATPGKPVEVKRLRPGEYLAFTAWDQSAWRGDLTRVREEVERRAARLRLAPGERTGIELKLPAEERER